MLPLKADALALREQAAGLLLSTFGMVAIGVFLLPTNRIFDRVPPLSTLLAGMLTIAEALLGLSLAGREESLFAVMAIYGIGFAFMFPSMNALLTGHVPEGDRGKAFGLGPVSALDPRNQRSSAFRLPAYHGKSGLQRGKKTPLFQPGWTTFAVSPIMGLHVK